MTENQITERSKLLFIALAEAAADWSGTPLVSENVDRTKEDREDLERLEQAGLLTFFQWEGETWAKFTDDGIAAAKANGVDLSWIERSCPRFADDSFAPSLPLTAHEKTLNVERLLKCWPEYIRLECSRCHLVSRFATRDELACQKWVVYVPSALVRCPDCSEGRTR